MKANELMIGDWVSIYGTPTRIYNLMVVDPITNPSLITRCYVRKDVESPNTGIYRDAIMIESEVPLKDIQPIPLTAEILDKNCEDTRTWYGKSIEWTWYNEENGSYIELSKHAEGETCEDDFFFSVNGGEYYLFKITYVHELQHALRLCGIEKEVVL